MRRVFILVAAVALQMPCAAQTVAGQIGSANTNTAGGPDAAAASGGAPPAKATYNNTGVQVNAGFLWPTQDHASPTFYDTVDYNGKTIHQSGAAPKQTDTTNLFLTPGTELGSDAPNLSVNLSQYTGGAGTINHPPSLFNVLGIPSKFNVPTLRTGEFRSVAGVNGRLDGKQINGDIGVETRPFVLAPRPFQLHAGQSFGAWFIPGATFEQQWHNGTDTPGKTQSTGDLTYRFFLGTGFGWAPHGTVAFTYAKMLQDAPDKATLLKNFENQPATTEEQKILQILAILADPSTLPPPGGRVTGEPLPTDFDDPEKYKKILSNYYIGYVQGATLGPNSAIWIERRGLYAFTGAPSRTGSRFDDVGAVVFSYWQYPKTGSPRQIQIRYEEGHPTESPGTYVSQVLASVGLSF